MTTLGINYALSIIQKPAARRLVVNPPTGSTDVHIRNVLTHAYQ